MTEIKTRLTQAEQQALQAKLFALLARQVRNYTKGESDSVPVETAQALLDSICFTLADLVPRCWSGTIPGIRKRSAISFCRWRSMPWARPCWGPRRCP